MTATDWRSEIVEVEPEDPNHWNNFDLEEWVARVLWQIYFEKLENQKSARTSNGGAGEMDNRGAPESVTFDSTDLLESRSLGAIRAAISWQNTRSLGLTDIDIGRCLF